MRTLTKLVALACCCVGCRHDNIADRPRLLDNHLDYPRVYMVEYNTIVIYPQLKAAADPDIVKRDIVGFLSGNPSIQAKYPSDEKGPTACRPRDFWALVLAKLTGHRLEIYVGDSPTERDKKISHFLQEIRDR